MKVGEMADFVLSQCFDIDEGGFDGFDRCEQDEYGQVISRARPTTCKHCQSTAVNWTVKENRWRLYDNKTKKPHICKEYKHKLSHSLS